jgi:hypothetical protein
MKTDPGNDDEKLSRLLREWRTDVSVPPRFQENVWQRVERAQSSAKFTVRTAVAHWIGYVLPRPALAVSYIAIVLAIGLTVGWAQARQTTSRVKSELGDRYVQSLDPYLTPRH